MDDIKIMAIESSCDETSVAVVKNGREIISNIISSQIINIFHTIHLLKFQNTLKIFHP